MARARPARRCARRSAAPPDPLARPRIEDRVVARRARARRAGPLRPRPAPRHLRRLRRRQVVAAGHDRPLDLGRRQRDRLVGERGREVREFIERDLGRGPRALGRGRRDVRPARARAHQGARSSPTAIAEHFRDQGADVMLMMDSVTRFAMAQREVGLADRRAARHARLHAERLRAAAAAARALRHQRRPARSPRLYTVLVDGDDMNEPIADAVRSILDGHVVLSPPPRARRPLPGDRRPRRASRASSAEIVPPEVQDAGQRPCAS